MRNAQYLCAQADLCLELARQMSDPTSVASLTEEAKRYRAEAAAIETGQTAQPKGSAHGFARATARSVRREHDHRSLQEKRAYYRLLRHLLSEKLERSYKEDQALWNSQAGFRYSSVFSSSAKRGGTARA